MWQTVVVLLILVVVLVYIIRHYAGVFRGDTSACSACQGSCRALRGKAGRDPCGCPPGPYTGTGGPAN